MNTVMLILKGIGIIVFLYIILLTVSSLLINPKKTYEKENRYYRFLLNISTACALKCARVRIRAEGMDRLPLNERFLLVSNHASNFDPIVTWYALRAYHLAFISKPENFKVPWFGRIIRKCCFLPIQRNDVALSIDTFRQGAALMKKGAVSVAVYPEGTRSKTGDLLPFHPIVFYMAKAANVPVAVMRIDGTREIRRRFPWRSTEVQIRIIETIPVSWVAAHDMKEICLRAEDDILHHEVKEDSSSEQDMLYPV